MGDDPDKWRLSRLDAGVTNSNRAATLSLKGRVDFTCLNRFSQTHFATAFRHISIRFSVSLNSECFSHALVVSVLLRTWRSAKVRPFSFPSLCVSTLWLSLCALCGPHDRLTHSCHGSRTEQRAFITISYQLFCLISRLMTTSYMKSTKHKQPHNAIHASTS